MIDVQPLSENEWLVTVQSTSTTKHRVKVTPDDLHRFGGDGVSVPQLLKASFRFLLEREPNTSILSSFDLPIIGRYFPEYPNELRQHLANE